MGAMFLEVPHDDYEELLDRFTRGGLQVASRPNRSLSAGFSGVSGWHKLSLPEADPLIVASVLVEWLEVRLDRRCISVTSGSATIAIDPRIMSVAQCAEQLENSSRIMIIPTKRS